MLSTYSISIHIINLIFMDQVNEPPKSKFKLILGVIVVLAVLAGAVYYYAWPKGDAGDAPPSLELDTGSNLQGLMQSTDQLNFAVGEAADEAAWDALNCADPVDVPKGISYYYLTKDMKAEDAIKLFKFSLGMKGLLAQYSAADKVYYMYPYRGPYDPTPGSSFEVKKAEADFEFSAYNGFIFISELDTLACGVKGAKDMVNDLDTPLLMDSVFPVPAGWVLLPTDDGIDLFQPYLEGLLGTDLASLWSQTEQNDYDLTSSVEPNDYAFTWFKFEKELTLADIGYPVVTSGDPLSLKSIELVAGTDVDSFKIKYNKAVILGDDTTAFGVCEEAEGDVLECVEDSDVEVESVTWDMLFPDYLTLKLKAKLEIGKTYVVSSGAVADFDGGGICSPEEEGCVSANYAILEVVEVEDLDTEGPEVLGAEVQSGNIWITMNESIVGPADDPLAGVEVCVKKADADECDGELLELFAVDYLLDPVDSTAIDVGFPVDKDLEPGVAYLVKVTSLVTDMAGNPVNPEKDSDVVEVAVVDEEELVALQSAKWVVKEGGYAIEATFSEEIVLGDDAIIVLCDESDLNNDGDICTGAGGNLVLNSIEVVDNVWYATEDISKGKMATAYVKVLGVGGVDSGTVVDGDVVYTKVEYVAEDLFSGVGGSCITDEGCMDGLVCGEEEGLCALPAFGEDCEEAVGCEDGLLCDPVKSICLVIEGAACAENADCYGMLGCDGKFCVKYNLGVGEECAANSECANDLVCDPDTSTCLVEELGECAAASDCQGDLICKDEQCQAALLAAYDESCAEGVSCEVGLACDLDDEKCYVADGLTCAGDLLCANEFVCGEGDVCVDGSDVKSPELISAEFPNIMTLVIVFDEDIVDSGVFLLCVDDGVIDVCEAGNALKVSDSSVSSWEGEPAIIVTLGESTSSNNDYLLTVSGVEDLVGNEMEVTTVEME